MVSAESVVPESVHRVLIKKRASRCLVFEVQNSNGRLLARSRPYTTICTLEASLSVLTAAAHAGHRVEHSEGDRTTFVMPVSSRRRVELEGPLQPGAVADLLEGLPAALIVDERPAAERRSDLSGRLCELSN